jgi:hypothetical protein
MIRKSMYRRSIHVTLYKPSKTITIEERKNNHSSSNAYLSVSFRKIIGTKKQCFKDMTLKLICAS